MKYLTPGMSWEVACHNIEQMTTDYQDENHWLKHKETGLMLKMEKQTGDHFELRKPK